MYGTQHDPNGVVFAPAEASSQDIGGNEHLLLGALALGMLWAVESVDYEAPQPWIAGLLLFGVLIVIAVLQGVRFAGWAVLAHTTTVAIADRIVRAPFVASDVLTATQEAIGVVAQGNNPYAHTFITTNPPNSPFPYLPGEIAFYAIPYGFVGDITSVDKWAGIGVVLLLALLSLSVGPSRAAIATALYGTFDLAAVRAVDGSNDTALAFLVVLALVLLSFSEVVGRAGPLFFYASAGVFAWALVFKQFSWLLYPFVLRYLHCRGSRWQIHAAITVGIAALVTLPFFLDAPAGFLRNVLGGLTYHQNVWGLNLWSALESLAPDFVAAVRPVIPIVGIASLMYVFFALIRLGAKDLGAAIFQSLVVLFIALFLARWTTSPYYTYASAVFAAAIALYQGPKPRQSRTALVHDANG